MITICQVRKMFPHSDFFFFKNGHEMQKAPFYHTTIKSYDVINEYTIFINI